MSEFWDNATSGNATPVVAVLDQEALEAIRKIIREELIAWEEKNGSH